MNNLNLTITEKSVLNAVKKKHLTSFEILKKVEEFNLILSLYNVLDDLEIKGVIKSYIKNDKKYHYAS